MDTGSIVNLLIYLLAFAIIGYMIFDAYKVSKIKRSGE